MFKRDLYYSITEVVKIFKITAKDYKSLLIQNNIPAIKKPVNLGNYQVESIYVLKSDVESLNLKKR